MDENSLAADNMEKCSENGYAEQRVSGLSFGHLHNGPVHVQHTYKNKVNKKESFIISLVYWADGKNNQQRKGGRGYGTAMQPPSETVCT